MATENPVKVLSSLAIRGVLGDTMRNQSIDGRDSCYEGFSKDLSYLLKDRPYIEASAREKEMLFQRSGSAPPSVEGYLAAMGGLIPHHLIDSNFLRGQNSFLTEHSDEFNPVEVEDRLRSDPEYLSYYYSHVNLNPRLPPPLISRENWRFAQHLEAIREKSRLRALDENNRSLFSSQPVLTTHNVSDPLMEEETNLSGNNLGQSSNEWAVGAADGLIGLSPFGLGSRSKSFADIIQEEFPRSESPALHQSRPSSRAAHNDGENAISGLDAQLTCLQNSVSPALNANPACSPLVNSHTAHSFGSAAAVTSLRSSDTHIQMRRSVTPSLGQSFGVLEQSNVERPMSRSASLSSVGNVAGVSNIAAALQNLKLADVQSVGASENNELFQQQLHQELRERNDHLLHRQKQYQHLQAGQKQVEDVQSSVHTQALQQLQQQQQQLQAQAVGLQPAIQTGMLDPNMYAAAAATMSYMSGMNPYYQSSLLAGSYPPHYGLGGYPLIHPMLMGYASPGTLPVPLDSCAMAVAMAASMEARTAVTGLANGIGVDMQHFCGFGGQSGSSLQFPVFNPLYFQYLQRIAQDARILSALSDQSTLPGYMSGAYPDLHAIEKQGSLSGIGVGVSYPTSSLANSVVPCSTGSPTSPLRKIERSPRLSSGSGMLTAGGPEAAWESDCTGDSTAESHTPCLLEEFKNGKTRCFELLDIIGQVVQFSVDQHGSRFIQQKLEVATNEEKGLVFEEILPHALTLMTDVFGNYVIQKFFEHGSPQQRRELGEQVTGHVLSLSLQMYGCRVIQKAVEVVEIDQQAQLVSELDGHIMRCVRDQNGNHVIQKCIECVPQDMIQFIISAFYGQVVALSTHPYGCRVIQRVLEHATDEQTQCCIMEEILHSVCSLSQDQYGNYVVQHVLEHGKPQERCEVIKKLAGHMVQMSQHKFASNVVEKCLEFGGPAERQLLINEILGDTDDNEPLQVMMKDQFANYVVQKVLETCDDVQRETLLSRIKVHLHALKKYTYGKHIVARVEKLVAAGERRSATHSVHKVGI